MCNKNKLQKHEKTLLDTVFNLAPLGLNSYQPHKKFLTHKYIYPEHRFAKTSLTHLSSFSQNKTQKAIL